MYKKQGIFAFILKFTALSVALVFIAVIVGNALITDVYPVYAEVSSPEYPVVIIDAGHGGMDGGASGEDGTLEKDCNLAVAKKLYSLFTASGIDAVMTRNDDVLLGDDTLSRAKADDLYYRVKFADKYEDAIYISIHANSFPVEKYNGLQVYFSPNNPSSQTLAQAICDTVKAVLQPENERQIKRSDTSIFLLDKLNVPAVIVECGFLSNRAECALLSSDEYRMKLALCIFASAVTYLNTL